MVINGEKITSGAPAVTTNRFARSAIIQNSADGTAYINTGTTVTPIWTLMGSAGGAGITQLTGEVTAGPGVGAQAATIAANAVTATKILNGAVTYAKIQDVSATNRLLGRSTALAGDVEEITVGGDLTQAGSAFTIGNGAVTYAKMQDVSASNRLLGRSTALAGDVEEITVGGDITQSGSNFNIAAGAVGTTELATGVASVSQIIFDELYTTSGGNLTETISIPGVVATDRVYAMMYDNGINNRIIVRATSDIDGVDVEFNLDPGADTIISVMVTRTVSA